MQFFNVVCLLVATGSLGYAVKKTEGGMMFLCLGAFAVAFYFLIVALITFGR